MADATEKGFVVKTIAHYERNSEMEVEIGVEPKLLNGNLDVFRNKVNDAKQKSNYKKVAPVYQEIDKPDVPDNGKREYYLESLLNYIAKVKGFEGGTPQFITNKGFLAEIASGETQRKFFVVQYSGIIFMVSKRFPKNKEEGCEAGGKTIATSFTHHANMQHFLTRESSEDLISPEEYVNYSRKAVLKLIIDDSIDVLYSGEIDAMDAHHHHVEMKAHVNGTSGKAFKNTCGKYWQSFFGDCPTLLVGFQVARESGQAGLGFPVYSLCDIQVVKRDELPDWEYNKIGSRSWTVGKCQERVRTFLKKVKDWEKDVCFTMSWSDDSKCCDFQNSENPEDKDEIDKFKKLVEDTLTFLHSILKV